MLTPPFNTHPQKSTAGARFSRAMPRTAMPIAVALRYRFKLRNKAKQLRGNCFYAVASRASLLKTISSCREWEREREGRGCERI